MSKLLGFLGFLIVVLPGFSQTAADYRAHGDKMIRTGQLRSATEAYEQSLEIDSLNPNAYFKCGLAYYGLKDGDKALHCFNKAIEIQPNYSLAIQQRSILNYWRQDYAAAIEDLDYVLARNPYDTTSLHYKIMALYQYGKYNEAVNNFAKLAKLKKHSSVDDLIFVGNCYLHMSKHQQAIDNFEKVLAVESNNEEALINRAFALLFLGKIQEACEEFRQVVESGIDSEAVVTMITDHCD